MDIRFYQERFKMSYCIATTTYNIDIVNRNKVKNYPYRISFTTSDLGIEKEIHDSLSNMKRSSYEIHSYMSSFSFNYTVTVFFKTKNDLLRYKLKSGNV